jgi:nicotinate-nucleotide adenylyltransferase
VALVPQIPGVPRLRFASLRMTSKKIGIFGGTFDPIHHAHLILARDALEALDLEKVIFVPAAASPHKLDQQLAPPEVRLEMLRAAIENEPGFEFDPMELQRSAPSYAVETIETVRRSEPEAELFYLIGEDNVGRLDTWHRFSELSNMVQFVVLERSGEKIEHPYRAIRRHLDISATNIRNRVATGRSIRYLVPPAVEAIIRDRQLYREPQK